MEWKYTENIVYHIPKSFRYTSNIAIFNFIDTLIKVNKNNVKFTYANVPDMLYDIHLKNASIIIYQSFSNKNIDHIKHTYTVFLDKVTKTLKKIKNVSDIPIMVFFSIDDNKFKKPLTGLWKMINLLYDKKQKHINLQKCIVIGHLAGRLDSNKNKKDKSVSDRAFANNINVKFSTPDGFFEKTKIKYKSHWEWDRNILSNNEKKYIIKNTKEIPNIFEYIYNLNKCSINYLNCQIIIITGLPFSGKTTLCKYLKRKWNENTSIHSNNSDNNKDIDDKFSDCIVLSDSSLTTDEINIRLNNTLNYLSNLSNSDIYNKENDNSVVEKIPSFSKNDKVIIIDVAFDYIKIINILKIIAKYKLYTTIVKPDISKKFIKLLNFIAAETEGKRIIKKHKWYHYHTEINKLSNLKNISYVNLVDMPLIPVICEEFWYEYSY